MKKFFLFATLALVLVLVTGCKEEEVKTEPKVEVDTSVRCTISYEGLDYAKDNMAVEIYVNGEKTCTLDKETAEYKDTFDGKNKTIIETMPVFSAAPTDTIDIGYHFNWNFDYSEGSFGHGPSAHYKGCPPDHWEDMIGVLEIDLKNKFIIENGSVKKVTEE